MKNSIDLLLEKNKEWILEKWLDRRLALFSNQKQSLIKTQMNQFQNPIRYEIHGGLKMILENLEEKNDKFNEAVEQNKYLIHSNPNKFILDERTVTHNPFGKKCSKLSLVTYNMI